MCLDRTVTNEICVLMPEGGRWRQVAEGPIRDGSTPFLVAY
jgi:hypothetical protein